MGAELIPGEMWDKITNLLVEITSRTPDMKEPSLSPGDEGSVNVRWCLDKGYIDVMIYPDGSRTWHKKGLRTSARDYAYVNSEVSVIADYYVSELRKLRSAV